MRAIYIPNLGMQHVPGQAGAARIAGVKSGGKAGPALPAGSRTRRSWVSDILEAQEEAAEVSPVWKSHLSVCKSHHPCYDCSLSRRRYSFIVSYLRNTPCHVAFSHVRMGGSSLWEPRNLSPSCARMLEVMVPGPACLPRRVSPPRTTPQSKIFAQNLM